MEITLTIKAVDNGLIVDSCIGTGLTAQRATFVYTDFMSMKRGVEDYINWFKPDPK